MAEADREDEASDASDRERVGDGAGTGERDTRYCDAVARLHPVITRLTDAMLRDLEKDKRRRFRSPYRSGQRITLTRAMQAESDARQIDRVWERRNFPGRPDPAFVIAADVSGSMRGLRGRATFEALVIMRECCQRLNIPLGIVMFSNRAWVAQHWQDPSHPEVIPALCRLITSPRGDTNMTAGVKCAGEILTEIPGRHRHLWLLSDGRPTGRKAARDAIASVTRIAHTVTGIGLGPETDALRTLIPNAMVNVTPEELPDLAASLFSNQTLIG
jgi:hypothetical protein